jgi:hypothetical protein
MTIITTWDNDGLKTTVTIPLGTNPTTGEVYPASTLVGKTLTAFLGNISAAGVVSGAVAATSISSTEAVDATTGILMGRITALWSAAAVVFGRGKRVQVIVDVPGDKKYTIIDQTCDVQASLG